MGIFRQIINIIFPAVCKQCDTPISSDTPTAYFCKRCWDGVKWFDGVCCPRCGMPYPSIDRTEKLEKGTSPAAGHLCGACHKNPPCFDKTISAGPYEGVLAEAVKLFKYKKKIHIGRALANQMIIASHMRCHSELVSESQRYIIPVPLHPKRLREREFNQCAIIASELGERLGIPVLLDVIIRSRHTRPQVELDMKERGKNVVGAFTVREGEVIEGKDIILVDDVYTTGSTVNECAKVLKKNGASAVYVVTIARMVG